MVGLKDKLRQKIEEWRPRTKRLMEEFGDVVIDQVTIEKAIGGMRDLKVLVTDISYLDPNEGKAYFDIASVKHSLQCQGHDWCQSIILMMLFFVIKHFPARKSLCTVPVNAATGFLKSL